MCMAWSTLDIAAAFASEGTDCFVSLLRPVDKGNNANCSGASGGQSDLRRSRHGRDREVAGRLESVGTLRKV